jgi:hypothetical protein
MSDQTPQSGMQYPVVVRPEPPGQFTAEAVGLPELRATCADRAEAINRVRLQLCQWFASGQLVLVDVPATNPLLQYAGWAKDDPDYAEYLEEIRRYRAEVDAQFQQEEAKQACSNTSSTPTT